MGHPNSPPPIFNNQIHVFHSAVTFIVTHTTNCDGHGLQTQWNHRQQQGGKYVYTNPISVRG